MVRRSGVTPGQAGWAQGHGPQADAQQGQELASFQRIKHTNPSVLSMQTACWRGCVASGILEHIANPEILVGATFQTRKIFKI
jgi:hypothetical protein